MSPPRTPSARRRSPAAPSGPSPLLERLLSTKEVLIACGAGGVGKTTTAAALALGAAFRAPVRVLVLTVDPARRLADALGLEGLGDEVRPVPPEAFTVLGAPPQGELHAAMLDTKQSWDALVARHAPSPAVEAEILANPFYVNLTERFARSHEYIAMERLYELYADGTYDLIVVDTPPALGALDFLDAPEKMAEFFSSRLLRWLTVPARSRLVGLASRPFTQLADRVLGSQLLEELAVFFNLFQSMYPGFVARANAVSALLREPQTTFMVVTSPEPVPVREARAFVGALAERQLHLGLVVANKALPQAFADREARHRAESLTADAARLAIELSNRLPARFPDAARLERVLGEVGASFTNFSQVATREQQLIEELAGDSEQVVRVPHLMRDVTDLSGLLEISDHLFG